MRRKGINSKISLQVLLMVVLFVFFTFFPLNKVNSSELKSQDLSAGPFDLSWLWTGELISGPKRPEISSISVNQKSEISEGGITAVEGSTISFSYNPDDPKFSIGGGIFSDKSADGAWASSLASANSCSSSGVAYEINGKSYIFKICGLMPGASIVSDDPTILSCSAMSCSAVSAGTVRVEARIESTILKAWGTNTGGSVWSEAVNVSLSSSILSWDITVVPPPSLEFSSSSQNIPYETSANLNWTAQNVDSCVASDDWSEDKPLTGTSNTGNLYGTKRYTLTCNGPGGSVNKTVTITVGPPNPSPTLDFSASSLSVDLNTSTTLNWTSANATVCTASGDWSGDKGISGSESTGNLSQNRTYILTCSNSAGSISRILTINVITHYYQEPTLNFSSDKLVVIIGQSLVLTWSSTNATTCTASDDWSENRSLSGSETMNNITSNKKYTLTCSGPGGIITQNINVAAAYLPEISNFYADDSVVAYNTATTLRWTTNYTSSCYIKDNGSWSKYSLALNGSISTPTMTSAKTYTLYCSGAAGNVSRSISVAVNSPPVAPTLTFWADTYNVPFNGSTTLRWQSQDAQLCTASINWSGTKNLSGTYSTGNLLSNKTYILTCSNGAGSVSASITIIVAPPPIYGEAPTLNFYADSYNLYTGKSTNLRWTATNATACIASGSWSGSKALSSYASTGALTSSKVYILTCSNNAGSVAASVTITVSNPYPSVVFTADATQVVYNTATNLRWSTSNANSCVASGSWSGNKALSGSELTVNITENKTYTLTCTNAYGLSYITTQTISIGSASPGENGPGISFWADKFSVTSGSGTILRWNSTNATSCTASGGWSGVKTISGTASTGSLTAVKTYVLTCSNSVGLSVSMEVKIEIGASVSPSLSFWADSINVNPNTSVNLHWRSKNVTTCMASGDWSGSKTITGNETTLPISNTKRYQLTCSGPSGNVTSFVNVTVGATSAAGPEINFYADSYTIPQGTSTSIYWSSLNANYGCVGSWTDPANAVSLELNSFFETGNITTTSTYTITCSGDGGQVSSQITIRPATFIICPSSPVMDKKATTQLRAYYKDDAISCDNYVGSQEVTNGDGTSPTNWISGNSSIVSVSGGGEITANEYGSATIIAGYKGLAATSFVSVMTDCWVCSDTDFSCSMQIRGGCNTGEFQTQSECTEKCRNYNWREVDF